MPDNTAPIPLLCHAATPCPLALALAVTLHWQPTTLLLHYRLQGQVDGVCLPPPAPPAPADNLWQHTCMEAFVSANDAPAYREFNFSPSGQWADYHFQAERVRDTTAEAASPALHPNIHIQRTPQQLDVWASLPLTALPLADTFLLGLSAVIEAENGHLSYWARRHPVANRPDFHHRGGWLATHRSTAIIRTDPT